MRAVFLSGYFLGLFLLIAVPAFAKTVALKNHDATDEIAAAFGKCKLYAKDIPNAMTPGQQVHLIIGPAAHGACKMVQTFDSKHALTCVATKAQRKAMRTKGANAYYALLADPKACTRSGGQ